MRPPLASVGEPAAAQVLVVDDHRVFAEALAHRLRRVQGIAGAQVACTLEEARVAVARLRPDVVLLDQELGHGQGLDLVAHLDDLTLRPRVVVLSEGSEPPASVREQVSPPTGWVSKESRFEDLLAVLGDGPHAPLRAPSEPPTVRQLRSGRPPGAAGDPPLSGMLSERQAQVLDCLVVGMTRAEIAEALRLSRHTVRDHVRHLFRIAGVHSTPELVARAGRAAGPVRRAEPPRLRMVPDP